MDVFPLDGEVSFQNKYEKRVIPMTNIVGLDYVLLTMPSGGEDRERWFYQDLLGLTETPKP